MRPILTSCILLLFSLVAIGAEDRILVTETTVKIGSMGIEELYFGFEQGDEIIFSFELVKGKNLNEVEIFEYPETSVYMDFKTSLVQDKSISVRKKGIYKFSFRNKAMGNRVAKVKIERVPATTESAEFNTLVYWRTVSDTTYYTDTERYLIGKEHKTKTIVPTAKYYVNSGSNATFKGGKSRVAFPVTLPLNTVEWYYQFTATRDESEIKKTTSAFDLAGDLSKLIDETGALSFGIEALTQPPGANYCDIYLMSNGNRSAFEAKNKFYFKASGTRENIKSGLVQIKDASERNLTIGIKNPDSMHGIHVAIEVVAVVLEIKYGKREVEKFKVKSWDEPYLK